MKSLVKNWIVDLIFAIITLTIGILLVIPSIAVKIISIIVGILLILFFSFFIIPKLRKIRSFNTEWVIWIILEAILIIALAILAIVNRQTTLDLGIIVLQLSHIVGVVFVIEGTIGIVKLCNQTVIKGKHARVEKYLSILLIIIGTYIFTNINITDKTIAIIISAFCFVLTVIFILLMIKFMPKKEHKIKNSKKEGKTKTE